MTKRIAAIVLSLVLLLPTFVGLAVASTSEDVAGRRIELPDILAWKAVRDRAVSPDGRWLAYVLQPNEGDSEFVVRSVEGAAEYRFDAGERPPFGGRGALAFSDDSAWLALGIRPSAEAAKKARKSDEPLLNAVGLIELSNGEMEKFEAIRGFAFGGVDEIWLAIHKEIPESQSKDSDKWSGSDLILRRLADGVSMTVGSVSEFAFNEGGALLATAIDTRGRAGNGVQLRDLSAGRVVPLASVQASYEKLAWTEEGDALTVLRGVEDEGYEDDLYSVVAFSGLDQGAHERIEYAPAADESFPEGMTIHKAHAALWNAARDGLVFRIHEAEAKEGVDNDEGEAEQDEAPETPPLDRGPRPGLDDDDLDTADLVIWHWLDDRLQSAQQVQETRDRDFGFLATYRIDEGRFIRIADEEVSQFNPAPKRRYAVASNNDAYERMGNLDGRRYQDVYVADLVTGERRLSVEQVRWVFQPSPAGTHLLYFDQGNYWVLDLTDGGKRNLTGDLPVAFWNTEDDHNVEMPPIFQFGLGWSADGAHLLLSDSWDIWKVAVDGSEAVNLTQNGRQERIRYRRAFRLDPDADGIDLTGPVYVTAYGEWTKKGGIARLDASRPGVEMLLWDDASFGNLVKAEEADLYLYTREDHAESPNFWAADAALSGGRKITEANPQQAEFAWSSGVRLIDYTSAKGDKLQGALYLPAGYEPGESYPTIVYIYEKLSQRANAYWMPTANGFNKSVYTSNGYAVLMPDIVYQVDDPGMSAAWCVLPALDAAVATGIVDPASVGLHGHSWGGYQTSFLITQTGRFSAAVAGAPLTNMISMYSLIYKNSGGGNGAIFESSQGRFTGGPWDVPEAYVRNSPVYHAANVTTPLILLHNDKDGAVDFTQGVEYYNTLRRMEKPVVMLQYVGENHGLRKPANRKDYTVRMSEFFDHYLRDLGMPVWLREGIPHLELEDHLEAAAKAIAEQVEAAEKAAESVEDAGEADKTGSRDPGQSER